MGPDCGTAVVGGLGLGFANMVSPGPVGIVAASGTGAQQLSASSTMPVSGSPPPSASAVATCPTRSAASRPAKPCAARRRPRGRAHPGGVQAPGRRCRHRVREYAASLGTPVAAGTARCRTTRSDCCGRSRTRTSRARPPVWPVRHRRRTREPRWLASWAVRRRHPVRRGDADRGRKLGPVRSNTPLTPDLALGHDLTADTHTMVDFGDDTLTTGRAHPMIDPSLRLDHLERALSADDTAVVLLDVVLGHGAEPDPATALAPVISSARQPVVVTVVGTAADPQGLERQVNALAEAGAEVHLSNAAATRRAIGSARARPSEDHADTRRLRRRGAVRRCRRRPGSGRHPRGLAPAHAGHGGRPRGRGRRAAAQGRQ